jgi:hypothetical protein
MAGLINSPVPAIQNPLLKQAEASVEQSVGTGKNREDYLKVVVAGMRAAIGGAKPMLANLAGRPDPVRDCAVGAVNLVMYLRNIAKGTMPPQAMIPAATTLMLQALDFLDQAKIAEIGKPELARATHIFTNTILQSFGVTSKILSQAAGAVEGVTRDPAQLEALKRLLPQAPEGEAPPMGEDEEAPAAAQEA